MSGEKIVLSWRIEVIFWGENVAELKSLKLFEVPPVCTDLCRGEYTIQTDRSQLYKLHCHIVIEMFSQITIFIHSLGSQNLVENYFQPQNNVFLLCTHRAHPRLHC